MHDDDIIAFCLKCGGWIHRGGKSNCTCRRSFGRVLYSVMHSMGWAVLRAFKFIAGSRAPRICKTCSHWKRGRYMLHLMDFQQNYACNTTERGKWELAKPVGGIKFKQRIKDAISVLFNKGVVVRWYS